MTDPSLAIHRVQEATGQQQAETVHTTNKGAVFAALAAAGISRLCADFDGAGDSGQIETITATAGDAVVALPKTSVRFLRDRWEGDESAVQTLPLTEAIEELAYACLRTAAAGWENNDGAFGEFHFDVAAGTVRLELHERVMECVSSEHAF